MEFGAAHLEFKESFLTESVQACSKDTVPLLIGGDLNIIRYTSETDSDQFDGIWPFLLNAIIYIYT